MRNKKGDIVDAGIIILLILIFLLVVFMAWYVFQHSFQHSLDSKREACLDRGLSLTSDGQYCYNSYGDFYLLKSKNSMETSFVVGRDQIMIVRDAQ